MTPNSGNKFRTSAEVWWTMAIGGLVLTALGIVHSTTGVQEYGHVWLVIGGLCALGITITEPQYE